MKNILAILLIICFFSFTSHAQDVRVCPTCPVSLGNTLNLKTGDSLNVSYWVKNYDSSKSAITYITTNVMFKDDSGVVSVSSPQYHLIKPRDSAQITNPVFIKNTKNFNSSNSIIIVWPTGNGVINSPSNQLNIKQSVSLVAEASKIEKGIKVFPNPTSDIVYIQSPVREISGVEITDITGKSILVQQGASPVSIRHLNTAIYLLTVKFTDGSNARYRLMKE